MKNCIKFEQKIFCDKIKFFKKSFFYKMGDYVNMKKLLKWQKDNDNGCLE